MFEKEVLKLLQKISIQLETIALVQKEVKSEIMFIYKDLMEFQEKTLQQLSQPGTKAPIDSILN